MFGRIKKYIYHIVTLSITIIVGLLFLGLLAFNNWSWNLTIQDFLPRLEHVRQAKNHLEAGYFHFQGVRSGSDFVDIGQVWTAMDKASDEVDSALEAGHSDYWFVETSHEGEKFRNELKDLKIAIGKFRAALSEGWISKRSHIPEDDIEQNIEYLFEDARLRMAVCEQSIHEQVQQDLAYQRQVFGFIVGFWLIILVAVAYILIRIGRGWKIAEQNLRLREERFRGITENTTDTTIILDSDSVFLYISPSVKKLFDYSVEEVIGRTPADFVHEEDLPLVNEMIERAITDPNETFQIPDFRVQHRRGHWLQLEGLVTGMLDVPGVNGIVFNLRDTTDRRQAEKDLIEHDKMIRSTIDSTADGILVVNNKGKTLLSNDRFGELWRIPQDLIETGDDDKLLNHVLEQLVDPDAFLARVRELYMSDRTGTDYLNFNDGRVFERYSCPLITENNIIGRVWSFRDISSRVRAEEKLKESEQRLSLHVRQTPLAVIEWNLDFEVTDWNPAAEKIFGYAREEAIGRHAAGLILTKDFLPQVDGIWKSILAQKVGTRSTTKNVAKDGSILLCEWYNTPLVDDQGKTIGAASLVLDVTERKKAEDALKETLQTSADIVAAIPSALFIYRFESPDRLILVDANPEAEPLTGIKIETWRGKSFEEIWPRARETGLLKQFLNVMETGQTFHSESFAYKDNRIDSIFRIRAFRMTNNRLGVALESITERMRAYEILRESENRYRFIFKNIPVMLYSTDTDGCISKISNYWLTRLGYSRKEVIGKKPIDFLATDGSDEVMEAIVSHSGESNSNKEIPCKIRAKNGEILDVIFSGNKEFSVTGDHTSSLGVFIDVSRLKKAEHKVIRLIQAIEQSPVSVMILGLEGIAEYINPSYTKITGYEGEQVIGKKAAVLDGQQQVAGTDNDIWTAVAGGKTWQGNIQNQRRTGELYWEKITVSPIVDDDGETIKYLVIGEDITQQLKAHQKMTESDKLSAIGLLAAGVAHEFKNYLCGIIGNASLVVDDTGNQYSIKQMKETCASIIDIGEAADDLVTSLLTFSRASTDRYRNENLGNVITNTLRLMNEEMKKLSIDLIVSLDEVPELEVSTGRIQQLLLNLLINAQHAIKSNGVIAVSLYRREDTVEMRIGDTGTGIPPEMIGKIFDPFFSTKGVWGPEDYQGTGIGLSICRNIVIEHGGEINVASLVGAGTVFTVRLPLERNLGLCDLEITDGSIPAILFLTNDHRVIAQYNTCFHKRNLHVFWSDDPGYFEKEGCPSDIMVIADAALPDQEGFRSFLRKCAAKSIPCLIVNSDKSDNHPESIKGSAQPRFDNLPPLETILGRFSTITPRQKTVVE